jgi:aldehyde dehydrogenase (NAD+)
MTRWSKRSAMAKSLSVGPGIERTEFGANMGAMVSEGSATGPHGLRPGRSEGRARSTGGRP